MKKLWLMILAVFISVSEVWAQDNPERIKISYAGGETIVEMLDNSQAEQFLAMLPLDVVFDDFARKEKIFYPPRKINCKHGQKADNVEGDFCYFAPWGNIAVFYEGMGRGTRLFVLGRIIEGKETLKEQGENFNARIEAIK